MIGHGQEIPQTTRRIIIIAVMIVLAVSWLEIIDHRTKTYVNSATAQALAAYATARVLNGVISVAESVEFSIPGIGGVAFQPFEALTPLNNILEQYSSVMQLAIGSLITQKVLIEIVSTSFFKILITLSGIALIGSIYVAQGKYSSTALKIFALAGVTRFLFVMVVLMNGLVDHAFVDQQTKQNMAQVGSAAEEIRLLDGKVLPSEEEQRIIQEAISSLIAKQSEIEESISEYTSILAAARSDLKNTEKKLSEAQANASTFDRYNPLTSNANLTSLRDQVRSLKDQIEQQKASIVLLKEDLEKNKQSITVQEDILSGKPVEKSWLASIQEQAKTIRELARVENVLGRAEKVVSNLINLMAIFILKTLILPLIFLLIFLRCFRYLWNADPRTLARQQIEKAHSPDALA